MVGVFAEPGGGADDHAEHLADGAPGEAVQRRRPGYNTPRGYWRYLAEWAVSLHRMSEGSPGLQPSVGTR